MTTSRHSVEQEEVMAYLDGELSIERAAAAAGHLEHCSECQSLADDFRKLSQRMMEWEVESSDPRVVTGLSAVLDLKTEPAGTETRVERRTWLRWLTLKNAAWAGAFAVIVLCVLAISIPNLYRSRNATIDSATLARLRQEMGSTPAPSGAPAPLQTYAYDSLNAVGRGSIGKLPKTALGLVDDQRRQSSEQEEGEQTSQESSFTPQGPMIIRTAALTLVAQQKDFDSARSAMDEILKRHHGYFGELTAAAPQNGARSIKATLRVPASELDATMAELKKLGRVESETQGGEEVTSEYIDLEARLANARHTEQRLAQIQAQRTGKLADVLKVEVEIARVRGEIEEMEAQRKNMRKQVDFATIDVTLNEEYKAPLQSVATPSTSTQFHNAFVEGYRNVADGVVALLLFLISYGPTLLLWGALLFFIGRFAWKKIRRSTVN